MAHTFSMDTQDKHRIVVIGGSVAGLAAANRLVDLGMTPLVIEGGSYPAFRVCGEFLSFESLPYLEKWGITADRELANCRFVSQKVLDVPLDPPGGGMSRSCLEMALLDRLRRKGVDVFTNTKVSNINPPSSQGDCFYLELSSKEELRAEEIIIATGRLFSTKRPSFSYVGMKAHFRADNLPEGLEMYFIEKGYLGISPIGENLVNVAIISKRREPLPDFIGRRLASFELLDPGWVSVEVPEFGIKSHPGWPHTYLVGDAAATIPPIIGGGLGMAVTSGVLAADYAAKRDPLGYYAAWKKHYNLRLKMAQVLHKAALKSSFRDFFLQVCHHFPSLPRYLYKVTR